MSKRSNIEIHELLSTVVSGGMLLAGFLESYSVNASAAEDQI